MAGEANRAGDLTPSPRNPRSITPEALTRLGAAMLRFGDLSGIVRNLRTGHLIGGHQRLRYFHPDCPVTITERFAERTAQGTVAHGYVDLNGERWTYREVDVSPQVEDAMRIAANAHGGEFDEFMLAEQLKASTLEPDLLGFDAADAERLLKLLEPAAPPTLEEPLGDTESAEPIPGIGSPAEAHYRCPECGHEWTGSVRPPRTRKGKARDAAA